MSTSNEPTNPNRYKDNAQVFNKTHGWGRTFNPCVGSYRVEVVFGNGRTKTILSIHEDELSWPITYTDRCLAFGARLSSNEKFAWLYSPNDQLDGISPRDAIDDQALALVEEVFERTFPS